MVIIKYTYSNNNNRYEVLYERVEENETPEERMQDIVDYYKSGKFIDGKVDINDINLYEINDTYELVNMVGIVRAVELVPEIKNILTRFRI